MNKINYEVFNKSLLNLRETFHGIGNFNDSNEKLDEIIKLLVINFSLAKKGIKFNLDFVQNISTKNNESLATSLQNIFNDIISDPIFFDKNNINLFEKSTSLKIDSNDTELAKILISEISSINFYDLFKDKNNTNFDIINECFGHFVRDNFRNNKEDAQYMTPQEIVVPILKMVFNDIFKEQNIVETIKNKDGFKIMDPTCGVGTLIVESLKYLNTYINNLDIPISEKKDLISILKNNSILGQDKVERMGRMAKINMLFENANTSNISIGNSILGETEINKYLGKIDFIITNPPFGAKYSFNDLKDNNIFPIINSLPNKDTVIDSELILIDKCISLLKENGKLVIVLPDSVISSTGHNLNFRKKLNQMVNIKAIIELPAVTFAQAGTRTKACILYLEKKAPSKAPIFMAVCNDIGYTVKEKLGIPVKIENGVNEMIQISSDYVDNFHSNINKCEIISQSPSTTLINKNDIIDDIYTPNFYGANRLKSIIELYHHTTENFEILSLKDLVNFDIKRKNLNVSEDIKHISILHIDSGMINFEEALKFSPISKGIECFSGEILFSKLNPRIPRVAVIPESKYHLVCSKEFEVLSPKEGYDPYIIYALIMLPNVYDQILSLTSGTSSSHNRIKVDQLKEVKIPVPKKGTLEWKELNSMATIIQNAFESKYTSNLKLKKMQNQILNLFTNKK